MCHAKRTENMETNQHPNQDTPRNADSQADNQPATEGKARHDTFQGEEIEDPAANSEIGANIYDIGMGGPGASTSGLRSGGSDDEDAENEDD
jgi:hypothetical protein